MRDAFGGTYMMTFMIVFIVVFVSVFAIALNYSKTYRVKNKIIDYIEQNEGFDQNVANEIEKYLGSVAYQVKSISSEGSINSLEPGKGSAKETYCSGDWGYCITKTQDSNSNQCYYLVETYVIFDLPVILGRENAITIPVRGETRVVVR